MQILQWIVSAWSVVQTSPTTPDQTAGLSVESNAKIAIIGAGIAASAVVARLLKDNATAPAHITVFEKESFVGGRVKSFVHENGEFGAIEEGAAYFSTDDKCILNLVERADLKYGAQYPRFGLRNGIAWPLRSQQPLSQASCNLETTEWLRMQDLILSHGSSFWLARNLVERVKSSWDFFLFGPERDIERAIHAANLSQEFRNTAKSYLKQYDISDLEDDVLTPCARARSYKHGTELSALSFLLSARSITNTGVIGGNQQVIQRILEPVDVRLTTIIDRIRAGTSRAYAVEHGNQIEEFDYVVITAPLGISNIAIDLSGIDTFIGSYEERHVTLVATNEIDMKLVGNDYLDVREMDDSILTSRTEGNDIDALIYKVKCGKYRCAQRDELESSDDDDGWRWQSVYKIISRSFMSDEEIRDLVSTSPTFIHRQNWTNALPKWQENEIPETAELAPGLFYTPILEHVVSSMEMSCRTGRHVAEHIRISEMNKLMERYKLSHSF